MVLTTGSILEEATELLENLGRCYALPWKPWAHACVAVAAVHVAHEATGQERSFTRVFMKRLGREYSQAVWEDQFGKRIEFVILNYFPDDLRGSAAFRYVGPLYRHAGIPAIALPRFAQFLRRLISDCGPGFTRHEYDTARQRVSGIASRFLGSEYGFQYARNAARILHQIDIGLIGPTELDGIPGYRSEFWSEILEVVGKSADVERRAASAPRVDPHLALLPEDGRLVLRFDQRDVRSGAVRLDGRSVLYAEIPVSGCEAPRLEINGRLQLLDRWWAPGQSAAALFRGSDGRFVASEGRVPAGDYYLVAKEDIAPDADLAPDELDYLANTDYRIWRIKLLPETAINATDLQATGSRHAPLIDFARSWRHSMGGHFFEDSLPDLLLWHWDAENATRFWIFMDDGSGPRRLEIEPGGSRLHLNVPCPASGAIWVEARGFYRQSSALPYLRFTVLPKGVRVEFSPTYSWIDEPAFVQVTAPSGWKTRCVFKLTESGKWHVPPGVRVFDGELENGALRLPFSLRVPRVGLHMQPPERIWWEECSVSGQTMHVEGAPGQVCSICLINDQGVREISTPFKIAHNGITRLRGIDIRDALALNHITASEFGLAVTAGQPLRAGWHYASATRIRERIQTLSDHSSVFSLPIIGAGLRNIRDLHRGELATLDFTFNDLPTLLRQWFADLAWCAHSIDATTLSVNVIDYTSSAVKSACDWYRLAVACTTPGPVSAEILKAAPPDLAVVPLDRWKAKFKALIRRLEFQSDVTALIKRWRDAVKCRDNSAVEEAFAKRSEGGELTEGAQRYLTGMGLHGQSRMRALNSAIGSFQRVSERTNCPLIRAVASGMLTLAYNHSGRSHQITDELRAKYQTSGLQPDSFSPWDGDYGIDFASTRTMEADSGPTERP
jgi:hypothetical protein